MSREFRLKIICKTIQIILSATEETHKLGYNYIADEHIFLGLLKNRKYIASKVLRNFGFNLRNSRSEIEKQLGKGIGLRDLNNIVFTPSAKMILKTALYEAEKLNHNFIDTEHLLLAIIKHDVSDSANLIKNLGVKRDEIRIILENKLRQINQKNNFNQDNENLNFDYSVPELKDTTNIKSILEILGIAGLNKLISEDVFYEGITKIQEIHEKKIVNPQKILLILSNEIEQLKIQRKNETKENWDFMDKLLGFEPNSNDEKKSTEKKDLEKKNKSSVLWKVNGDDYREKAKYEESIISYNNAINQEKDYSSAYLCRGFSQYCLLNFDKAKNDWQKAINYSRDKSDTYLSIGNFHFSKINFCGAIKYYDLGLTRDPRNLKLLSHKANAKRMKGDYEGSFKDFKHLLTINKSFFEQDAGMKFIESYLLVEQINSKRK